MTRWVLRCVGWKIERVVEGIMVPLVMSVVDGEDSE